MLHLLTTPSGPAPSGSSGTSRFRRGRLPPSPAFPRIRLPPGFNRAAATTQREGLSPSSINQAPRGAQLGREETRRRFQNRVGALQFCVLPPQPANLRRLLRSGTGP